MLSFFSTVTQVGRRKTCRRQWIHIAHARCMISSAETHRDVFDISSTAAAAAVNASAPKVTFDDLGLHPPIIASMRSAFPHIEYPTDTQSKFIPAILDGRDILLKDATGSGKSFGLILALLNKPRLVSQDENGEKKRHITSLVVVPHRELAFQLLHWIERMVNVGDHAVPLPSIAQVLVRDGKMHLGSGLQTLREVSPHVLIGTPQALMDAYESHPEVLQLGSLSSVVVDEVDYLVETPARKEAGKSFWKAAEKAKRKLLAHPGPTRLLLNTIYGRRMEVNERRKEEPGWEIEKRRSGVPTSTSMPPAPQLILSSATLRTHLRNYVYDESGWLDKDKVVKISGSGVRPAEVQRASDDAVKEGGHASVEHSVLLVSEQRVRNIPGAVTTKSPSAPSVEEEAVTGQTGAACSNPSANEVDDDIDADLTQKYSTTTSVFSPYMMETIAAAFALDVPSVALLVLPSSAPLKRAVWELRELGVNAHGLDLQNAAKGRTYLANGDGANGANPTLLVSTLATTRGLDLPTLSHVFLYGLPEGPRVNGKSVDAYLHISGRVGRFGRGGKVVTLVEELEEDEDTLEDSEDSSENSEARLPGDGGKMARILTTIKVSPVRFAAFD